MRVRSRCVVVDVLRMSSRFRGPRCRCPFPNKPLTPACPTRTWTRRPAASRVLDVAQLWRIDDRTIAETTHRSSSPAMRVFIVLVHVQKINMPSFPLSHIDLQTDAVERVLGLSASSCCGRDASESASSRWHTCTSAQRKCIHLHGASIKKASDLQMDAEPEVQGLGAQRA